ncbi:MAG: asparagine synthase (glutamine-hydrolyzing) [Bacteroidetes bacterium]|nr:MAG: asparagine synthase (glutamine-hydrolyzing) [Bacteroidota bacterium]
MCGIIGRLNYKEAVDEKLFLAMRDTLTHRGPDDFGFYQSDDKRLALGHRRLSINDLSIQGRQPMSNEDGSIWLTCNGEIYNYLELKSELIDLGHKFSSASDSEVIIHGYEEWGSDVVNHLKGMFAFGIWDEKKKQLFLARDRFGIKPLYYYSDENTFIFCSEIKAIREDKKLKKEIDYSSMCNYLTYRYVPSPKTIWHHVFKLPPAHCATLDASGRLEVVQYWVIPIGNESISDKELIQKIDGLLANSVKSHLLSDVPVGSFLSGGYDSSALVYYMNRMNRSPSTFSIGFEDWAGSEHKYAETVSELFGTDQHNVVLNSGSLELTEKLAFFYDEPIADISIIPTYVVSKLASESLKVVFSGEGADELFCGYNWHQNTKNHDSNTILSRLKGLFSSNGAAYTTENYASAMSMGTYNNSNLLELLDNRLHEFIPSDSNWFYKQHFKGNSDTVKTFQYMDVKCFMAELVLTKIDRASMANSLEVRVPFLDHELFECIFKLNDKSYFKPEITKFALHENIVKHLPPRIMDRKKQGFVGPDIYYMDMGWYKSILLSGSLISDNIVRKDKLESMIGKGDHWRLWKLAVLELWYSKWA